MTGYYKIDFKDEEYQKVSNYLSKNIKNSIEVNSAFCVGYLSKDKKGGIIILDTARDNISGLVTIDKDFPDFDKIKKDLEELIKK